MFHKSLVSEHTLEFMVFWVVVLCNVMVGYSGLEDHAACIFRAEVHDEQKVDIDVGSV